MRWTTTGVGRGDGSSNPERRGIADAHPRQPGPAGRWTTIRDAVSATTAPVLGIVPHVLHHLGVLAGAALITGATGNAVFYAVGLLLSVPMLRRLHRRFGSLWAPTIAVAVFTGLFSVSAFVIGPAISGDSDGPPPSSPTDHSPGPLDEHGH